LPNGKFLRFFFDVIVNTHRRFHPGEIIELDTRFGHWYLNWPEMVASIFSPPAGDNSIIRNLTLPARGSLENR
jgi:hypothetical protein